MPSCQGPLTRLTSDHPHPTHGSLAGNELCGVDEDGDGEYTTEGITALCTGLKGSAVTLLECAAALKAFASLSCQRPLTRLISHRPRSTFRSQARSQPHRRRGRLGARRGPQGQLDPAVARVGCLGTRTASRAFAFMSAPADTAHHPPLVPRHPHPPLATVCSTVSSTRTRRRRSETRRAATSRSSFSEKKEAADRKRGRHAWVCRTLGLRVCGTLGLRDTETRVCSRAAFRHQWEGLRGHWVCGDTET